MGLGPTAGQSDCTERWDERGFCRTLNMERKEALVGSVALSILTIVHNLAPCLTDLY